MSKQIIKINNTDLSVKEFKGQRVVTFKDIDMLHKRVEGTTRKNFGNNKKHFILGEDYYVIKPSDVNNFPIQINNAGLTILTESGYLMLVKSLQDDLAWKVQRELVNRYFRTKEIYTPINSINPAFNNLDETVLGNMNLIAQNMQFMSKAMTGIQQYVQDSIQAKDNQIDKAMELIGLRARNVARLTGKLKEVLIKKYGRSINASDIRYINAKNKIFREFKVYKWEEIPVGEFNRVFAYIEECL